MESFLGIGELARASGLPVSALRFYDGAGVLVPASVDPRTGYRHYRRDQVPAARLVARLRRVGMPLDSVRALLAGADPGPVLDAHLARLADGLAAARRELSTVRVLLDRSEPPCSCPCPPPSWPPRSPRSGTPSAPTRPTRGCTACSWTRTGQLVLELDSPITPLALRTPGRDWSLLMPVRLPVAAAQEPS